MKRHVSLILMIIALFTVAAGCFPTLSTITDEPQRIERPSDTPTPLPTLAPPTTFGINESAELNGIVATLVNVEESEGNNMFAMTDEGKIYVICTFEIENNSGKEIIVTDWDFSGYIDDYATDTSYSATIGYDVDSLSGTVADGKKIKGAIGFEVDKDWSAIEIHYEPDWGGKSIIFKYEKLLPQM